MILAPHIIKDFQTWVQREGPRVSERTAEKYARYSERFVKEYGHPSRLDRETIDRWREKISYNNGTKAAPSTVNVRIAAIRAFLDFCVERGICRENLAKRVSMAVVPKRLPRPVNPDVLEALFKAVYEEQGPHALQDRAIMELLYGSGLRREEAGRLRLGDVVTRTTLRVVGKGNKERITILTGRAYTALRDHALVLHGDEQSKQIERDIDMDAAFTDLRRRKPDAPFFVTKSGKPLPEMSDPGHYIWKRQRYYARKLGQHFTPHQLRHSCFTDLVNGGADITLVQQIAGHSDIRTTRGYVGLRKEGLERLLMAHPRGVN